MTEPSIARKSGLLAQLRRPEGKLLLACLPVVGAAWAFAALQDEVREGGTRALDRSIILWFRAPGNLALAAGPRWLQETERDFTALGGFTVLTLITVFAVAMLLIHGRRLQALIFLSTVVAAQVLSELLKHVIGRPRPDLVPQLDLTYSSSFPSGHATMAPVVYLTLAAILCAGEPRRSARVVITTTAAVLVVAIGVSRVYLGVHWPTDVLGGWTLGCALAFAASWALHRTAPKRGMTDQVAPDAQGVS